MIHLLIGGNQIIANTLSINILWFKDFRPFPVFFIKKNPKKTNKTPKKTPKNCGGCFFFFLKNQPWPNPEWILTERK